MVCPEAGERAGWQWNQVVPGSARQQDWYDYGDYLDLMGQPPKDGYGLTGARFWQWSFNTLSLARLGVLQRANIPTITSSGTYTVPALQPDPAGGRMALSIPVLLDGRKTWWVLEYRPPHELRSPRPTRLVPGSHARHRSRRESVDP